MIEMVEDAEAQYHIKAAIARLAQVADVVLDQLQVSEAEEIPGESSLLQIGLARLDRHDLGAALRELDGVATLETAEIQNAELVDRSSAKVRNYLDHPLKLVRLGIGAERM